jgi:hypothetical protein
MPRRKKAKKATSRRRRSMSGIGKVGSTATSALYVIAGAAAAGYVSKMLPATLNDKVKAAIPVAAGLILPRFIKSSLGQGLGAGMVAVGGLKLVQSFGVLNGIGYADSNYRVPMVGATYNREGLVDASMFVTPSIAGLDEIGA